MLHVEWYHVCWPRLTAKRVEPVVSISWASCIEAKDDRGGAYDWSYKSCKAPVKSSPPTNQHPTFYSPDALPVTKPTASNLILFGHWLLDSPFAAVREFGLYK